MSSSIVRDHGVVKIPRREDSYSDLLGEFREELRKAPLTEAQAQEIEQSLTELAKAHQPDGDGDLSTVIGHTHFDFKEVLFDSINITVKTIIASHTADVTGLIDIAIDVFRMVCTRFSRLNSEQVVIYWAMVELEYKQENNSDKREGFSIEEIIEQIEERAEITSEESIAEGLRDLTIKNVTKSVSVGHYAIVERWVK